MVNTQTILGSNNSLGFFTEHQSQQQEHMHRKNRFSVSEPREEKWV